MSDMTQETNENTNLPASSSYIVYQTAHFDLGSIFTTNGGGLPSKRAHLNLHPSVNESNLDKMTNDQFETRMKLSSR